MLMLSLALLPTCPNQVHLSELPVPYPSDGHFTNCDLLPYDQYQRKKEEMLCLNHRPGRNDSCLNEQWAAWRTCAHIHLLLPPMTFEYILVLSCIELYSWVWSMVAWLFTERKIIQISISFNRLQILNQAGTLRTINTKLLGIFIWIKEHSLWVFSPPLYYRQSCCEKLSLHKLIVPSKPKNSTTGSPRVTSDSM